MGAFALLSLLGLGLAATALSGDDTDDIVEEDEVVAEPEEETEPELGAVVEYDEETNTVTIEKGADEDGDVVVVTSRGQNDGDLEGRTLLPNNSYDLTIYLVPEGVDLMAALNGDHDAETVGNGGDGTEADDIAASVGATQLGQWSFDIDYRGEDTLPDLDIADGVDPVFGQMYGSFYGTYFVPDSAAAVTSEANLLDGFTDTEGDQGIFYKLRTEGEEITGTDKNDEMWIRANEVTARGGDGDDLFEADAGSGNALFGDGGDDTFLIFNDAVSSVDGGAGADSLYLTDFNGTATGGDGDDTILVGLSGSDADINGGAGDDQFIVYESGIGSLTGGEGADSYTLNPVLRDSLQPMTITDFDPAEDSLAVGVASDAGPYEITIVRDLALNRTEVRVTVPGVEAEASAEYGVLIHLEGAPEISESDIVLVDAVSDDVIYPY